MEPNVRDEIVETFGIVPSFIEQMPAELQTSFWHTMRDVQLEETEIPNKYKQLIGLAIAASVKCPYCTHFHTEAAKVFGATEAEVQETAALASVSAGASAFIHGAQIPLDSFKKETASMMDHVRRSMAEA